MTRRVWHGPQVPILLVALSGLTTTGFIRPRADQTLLSTVVTEGFTTSSATDGLICFMKHESSGWFITT
ncbi:hypothetical protein EVAR_47537_1 [Eumeta japonica]|uniref:Uncharacterized protein n=1 Tax=Eumeta variegata TaxID=151549 RepID=A0A4C1WQS4_EUMVA|nr:hypothetical protein EVAR_47537_1 [Eumeta japonica]